MAGGSKDLRYNVAVDASDASSSLKKLGTDVKKTAKDIESGFDDSASAGDKFKATVDELSGKLASEFKTAAQAADKLGTALKEAGSKMDVGDAVADLKRMGFTFEEITADADKFAQSLKQLDDVKASGIKELDAVAPGLATKLDDVNKTASSSKSVLANMIGNSAQDLGALGGIAGSTGVAIGQMGEYIADAVGEGEKLGPALMNMAKVAGPMAGLAAATYLVSNALGAIEARDKLRADDVKAFSEAIQDGDDAVAALTKRLTEAGQVLGSQTLAHGMEVFGRTEAVTDMTEDVARAGLTVQQFSQLVVGGKPAIEAWGKSMVAAGADGALIVKVGQLMLDMADDYTEGVNNAATATAFFGKTAVEEFADASDALKAWTERTAKAITFTENLERVMSGADWGAAALEGATSAMSEFSRQHFGLTDIAADAEEAFANLSKSITDNGKTFDVNTEAGRANQAALEDVATSLDTKFTAAYVDAGGSLDAFKKNAGEIADDTLKRLQKELGLSDEETAKLGVSLGLTEGDYVARFELSGAAEAQQKLDLLNVSLDDFDDPNARKAYMDAVVRGDYVLALEIAKTMAIGNQSVTYNVYTRYHVSGDRGSSGATPPEIGTGMAPPPAGAPIAAQVTNAKTAQRQLDNLTRQRTARINVALVPSNVLVRVNGGG